MPRMEQTVTATTTQEIKIAPQLRRKLLNEFRVYARLKDTLNATQSAMDKHKAVIAGLREETGEMSVSLEGFTTTLVAPIRKKFDKKRYVAEGGDLGIYDAAMVDVLSKPYEKISTPGSKDDGE